MSRIFSCDICNRQFPEPLDQEMYKDERGVWHTMDLCAPCRKDLKAEKDKTNKTFFDKAIKAKK